MTDTKTLVALVACPLCGAEKGYTLSTGSSYRWWSVCCAECGQEVSEARATYPAETTPRTIHADLAWNEAGKHAQSLRDQLAALAATPPVQQEPRQPPCTYRCEAFPDCCCVPDASRQAISAINHVLDCLLRDSPDEIEAATLDRAVGALLSEISITGTPSEARRG